MKHFLIFISLKSVTIALDADIVIDQRCVCRCLYAAMRCVMFWCPAVLVWNGMVRMAYGLSCYVLLCCRVNLCCDTLGKLCYAVFFCRAVLCCYVSYCCCCYVLLVLPTAIFSRMLIFVEPSNIQLFTTNLSSNSVHLMDTHTRTADACVNWFYRHIKVGL